MNNKLTSTELQSRLLQGNFDRGRSPDERFADPLMETSMIVTLEQLRPYDHNPRLMHNPNYDDIKASIRHRGLDTPPPITRRPGQEWYIIANGGNTRLSILNELWRETHDERFWRIQCLYKPWAGTSDQPMLGELRCLIGHLAENDMHGKLSFIERALGINKARELYQQVEKCQLSQRELAEHLKNDGYPINQSHISRMEQALEYLLPCIPDVLYAGMGRSQVEKLLSLRAASLHLWQRHAAEDADSFDNLFSSALSLFNDQPEDFAIEQVQDELLGLMSQQLNVDYNLLLLDVDPSEQKRRAVLGPTPEPPPYIPPEEPEPRPITRGRKPETEVNAAPVPEPEDAPSLLCEGTEPVTDIWRIPQLWDTTESLRSVSDRLAWDLAEYYAIDDRVNSNTNVNGIGFQVMPFTSDHPMFTRPQSRACWALLAALNEIPLTEELASALTPGLFFQRNADGFFFSDEFLIKAFRLIRIIRRIKELQQEAQHAPND
ncbi:ParB family protein [Klebsiella pneumoniae]|uniref:ParB family protein n=1 Tax=Klebsiella pneumoniae TaxID=573 RepID=UPI0010D747BA|nr:ParB family protein [Klebsiella pneumoniae]EKZ5565723.1 ParB family protein [Klebsiella pneumoniae]VTN94209.1 integrating conjugative element, PFGI_1 class, ParB family protein [Klebsiella pneumoniae]